MSDAIHAQAMRWLRLRRIQMRRVHLTDEKDSRISAWEVGPVELVRLPGGKWAVSGLSVSAETRRTAYALLHAAEVYEREER